MALAEVRRLALLKAIGEQLAKLDVLNGEMSGIQITVRFKADGTPRVVVVEPELRYEST